MRAARRVILPGVGHFAATRRLDETGITPAVRETIARGVPFLGICVGMQWLFAGSRRHRNSRDWAILRDGASAFRRALKGAARGLGSHRDPHLLTYAALCAGVAAESFVYYTHSYFVPPRFVATETAR